MLQHFSYVTAGESHGKGLVAIVEGMPAGTPIEADAIRRQLSRRQKGHGRGGRMKIERDAAEILAGVRLGEALGSPIAMLIPNRDWENWQTAMSVAPLPDASDEELRRVSLPRPGHADLVGLLKYGRSDARDILERSSARETAARVAAGALARALLTRFGISVGSHVVSLAGVEARRLEPDEYPDDIGTAADASPVRCLDSEAEKQMVAAIDTAKQKGDTAGGVFEVVARGVPVGLGSHVAADRRLDGRLAGALMSIQAMKGVEIGLGFDAARLPGSQVHDEIEADPTRRLSGGFRRRTNRAGGLEGGMTNGEPVTVRVAMKPLSTLMRPLRSVDLDSGQPAEAVRERSDVTAVPAAGIVGEAMVALVLADAMREKFGGDSLREMEANYESYVELLQRR
ncbi:MAG: chorismate synthase [Gemmatimonadetes bacterium]|uniref:Chorismate synthase n=1 Tax=Candidatus Kutchimonas denitrificans TaxID=3056748 RepID=A0AAE5CAW1_9BACT|nr:chorismate synthase [Gemmatimonadota bacterium]NIR73755.1 chorismate synthase [Candidatus Kutchimonas denitrificans]NIS03119.1 chorismate synthase [Gemmatimonadota bacterium]NIT69020.1 chorismate synthase [Gemmatimonadota bacterium]NIU54111.1 chorismate synthase [Gemmatimonadota bacterium]